MSQRLATERSSATPEQPSINSAANRSLRTAHTNNVFQQERTMRELTGHKVNLANDVLKVEVLDEPGSGGANHLYHITGFNSASNPSDPWTARHGSPAQHSTVLFQNG